MCWSRTGMTSGTMATALTLPLCPPGPPIQILINIEGSDYFSVITKLTSCCGLQSAWPANSIMTQLCCPPPGLECSPGKWSPAGGIAAAVLGFVKNGRTAGQPGAPLSTESSRQYLHIQTEFLFTVYQFSPRISHICCCAADSSRPRVTRTLMFNYCVCSLKWPPVFN